jgi:hypothetical protein
MEAAPGILNDLEMLHFFGFHELGQNILLPARQGSSKLFYALNDNWTRQGERLIFPVFVSMHGQTVALLKNDPRNETAKHFSRHQLGACHDLSSQMHASHS